MAGEIGRSEGTSEGFKQRGASAGEGSHTLIPRPALLRAQAHAHRADSSPVNRPDEIASSGSDGPFPAAVAAILTVATQVQVTTSGDARELLLAALATILGLLALAKYGRPGNSGRS